jgi:glycerophosphoryl diester phosphodiesterase
VTRLYAEHPQVTWKLVSEPQAAEDVARRRARPLLLAIVVLVVLALGIGTLLYLRLDLTSDVEVTAHRGASIHAPENTLAAFRAALDAGADYIELDVQRSRDGAVVVVHDGDLMRLGGDPRKIKDLALADLAGIDIGRRYDARFAGERVPTLEQVIALARGRAKINIELKYNVPDSGLAPAVIDLLRRENFLDQVVITSLDYGALKQVKGLEPSLKTGHIVTASVGNVAKTTADFVSLSSAQATASVIRRAHAAGKEVHVWTVDKPDVMLRMIERNVDNIITNDPARLRLVMQERNALSRAEILGLRLRVLFSEPPPELESATTVPEL